MQQGCGVNAYCSNVDGVAECRCDPGFSGDGEICTDINECQEEGELADECDEIAVCSNYEGGYTCECRPGFLLVGGRDCEGEIALFKKEKKRIRSNRDLW